MRSSLIFFLLVVSISGAYGLPAFFDHDAQTTAKPAYPGHEKFDDAILELCGQWGSHVRKESFKSVLLSERFSNDAKRLYVELDGTVRSKQRVITMFLNELTNVWFEQKGFEHVFCGEPAKRSLGGMHYYPRYQQAQRENWAGFADLSANSTVGRFCGSSRETNDGGVYSIPVVYQIPRTNNETGIKCLSGYNIEMDAIDILIEATRAYSRLRKSTKRKTVCVLDVKPSASFSAHSNVIVIDRDAIRTFYPITGKEAKQTHKTPRC